jgi:hypothetical protein
MEVPHLFVHVRLQENSAAAVGLASEALPPKCFTKKPATTFAQDLPAMSEVIGFRRIIRFLSEQLVSPMRLSFCDNDVNHHASSLQRHFQLQPVFASFEL